MKCLFIINPVSGTKSLQNNLKEFKSLMLKNTSFDKIDTFYTKKRYDATNKVKSLKPGDYDLIVAVGGDGTVNEVVSGLAESQSQIPMTLIPAGTVNDFASYLQIPTDPLGFSQMIAQNNIQDVDLGKVGDHYFINVLAGGMFADIAFQVTKEEKNILGPLAYYLTGLREFNNEINMEMHLKIEADGKAFEEDACLFLLTNSSFVGGFKEVTPMSSVQDGRLDLLIVKKTDILDLISILKDYSLFFENHLEHPSVRYIQASHIKIECDQNIIYDIDGEKGTKFPIEVRCLKHAIKMIVKKEEL